MSDEEITERMVLAAIATGELPPSALDDYYQTFSGQRLQLWRAWARLLSDLRDTLPAWLRRWL